MPERMEDGRAPTLGARLLWFAGLWLAGVASVGLVSLAIKWALR
ncbi:MAG: DUF2474 domain-containing protein [Hyphomicrobiales bacterium]|nr:MAG: DUF2474 domain-containing protein [Hyphomicrobiales bacterium]